MTIKAVRITSPNIRFNVHHRRKVDGLAGPIDFFLAFVCQTHLQMGLILSWMEVARKHQDGRL